ncbi:divergent polysaccharide deacetylase family protein [Orbaceae bacterium ESL0727]|nr:divergent polysaccharide deacetylase family protein [Orbaceae bacterium ESL0727]
MKFIPNLLIILLLSLFGSASALAAKLAIVIDDFGYRQHNEEQIIALSPNITIAVLPHSPNATKIATLAHSRGNDVIIHLPMAPLGKQPLEVNTLFPSMDEQQISKIITGAVSRVPYAVGVNNHMGSLMTGDAIGMQRVMKILANYPFFFLDSKTIGRTQVKQAAKIYNIPVITRDIFLDDQQIDSAIARQFDLAVNLARKNGMAIAIGHPHPQTVNVLKSKLATLPADIQLVKARHLAFSATQPSSIDHPSSAPLPNHPLPVHQQPVESKVTLEIIFEKYRQRWQQVIAIYQGEVQKPEAPKSKAHK